MADIETSEPMDIKTKSQDNLASELDDGAAKKPATEEKMEETEEAKHPRGKNKKQPVEKQVNDVEMAPAPSTPAKGRGRKRKVSESATPAKETPAKPAQRTPSKRNTHKAPKLSWETFFGNRIAGDRVLSCGEGDQLGHPGRSTTKKPRKVDLVEEENLSIVQVAAGGVHSLLLDINGTVYTCGINEKGTVPGKGVEIEGSTDEFVPIEFSDEIKKEGKIVQVAAGASFSAALTDHGSVIAWGNLRDSSGLIEVHPLLHKMKETPVVIAHHKNKSIAKIAAGENHLAMLSADGEILTFGDGTMGQLGRSTRANTIRSKYMCDEKGLMLRVADPQVKHKMVTFSDIHASGFWTIGKADDGRIFSFGLNNYSQLGVSVDKKPETIPESADKQTSTSDEELRVLLPTFAPAFAGADWVSFEGVQHCVAMNKEGELFAIGRNVDNALGIGTFKNKDDPNWKYDTLQKVELPDGSKSAGCTAKLTCSIAWNEDGKAFSWGCDTSGQLGLGLTEDDDKVVPTPQEITSAHLNGYKILMVSIADNHALFLAIGQKTD